MTLILDAFNILHAWHSSPSGDTWAEISALAELSRRGSWARTPVILVCDGPSPDRDRPELEVRPGVVARFAGVGSDADTVIEGLIDRSHTPSRLTVVSSDRRIERAARRRGCRSISAQEFLGIVLSSAPAGRDGSEFPDAGAAPEGLDAAEIDRWMRAFGVDPGSPPPSRRVSDARSPPVPEDSRMLDRARIDPADLDMEKWLRSHPPPDPGMEPRRPCD